jgi:hypothetical protein
MVRCNKSTITFYKEVQIMSRLATLTTVIGLLSATAAGAGGQRPIHVGALLATPHQVGVVNDIKAKVAPNLATPAGQQTALLSANPATFEGFPATVHQASSLGFAHARPNFKVRG